MTNLNLKNFAKIKDSDFDIKDITVFAGKPGSGKSYIMKMLYAVNEALTKTSSEIIDSTSKLKEIKNKYGKIHEIDLKKLSTKEIKELQNLLHSLIKIEKIPSNRNGLLNHAYKNILESIFGNLNQISSSFEFSSQDIKLKFINNELAAKLVNLSEDSKDEKIDENNNVFVETPLILEFKSFMNREEGKTPYHIESLLKILDKDYSFTDLEQDKFITSFVKKSKDIIQGNIENSADSFIFKTNESKNYDIINASSGIKSIGLLQYLVTNKALKKGSTLFWEEPEVHLHPTWQLKMVDLFIELMNAGVKVVFSTHSPFMADYLNAKAQREKFSERVSFNLLNEKEGVVSNTILNDENWNLLQDELMGAFKEIMWQYL